MRANFLQPSSRYSKLVDDDSRHSLPISQMGNYQDHLKKMPMPLREIESAPVRQHMFGNPFKINKNMIMDEVVMDEVSLVPNGNHGGSGSSSPKGVKRPAASPSPDSPSLMMGSKRMRKGLYLQLRSHETAAWPVYEAILVLFKKSVMQYKSTARPLPT